MIQGEVKKRSRRLDAFLSFRHLHLWTSIMFISIWWRFIKIWTLNQFAQLEQMQDDRMNWLCLLTNLLWADVLWVNLSTNIVLSIICAYLSVNCIMIEAFFGKVEVVLTIMMVRMWTRVSLQWVTRVCIPTIMIVLRYFSWMHLDSWLSKV